MGIKTNRIVSSGMLRGVSPSCTVLDAVVGLGVLRNTGMSGYVVLSPVTLASDWSRTRRAPRAEISPEAPEANPPRWESLLDYQPLPALTVEKQQQHPDTPVLLPVLLAIRRSPGSCQ